MVTRPAKESEMDKIRSMAEKFNLDTESMPADEFLVAEDEGQITGFVRLIKHPGCDELCSLGVIKEKQGQGIGKKLVKAIIEKAPENLYAASITPDFFEKLGFKRVKEVPSCMKKDPAWCEGCDREKCAVMKYEHP